MQKTAKPAALVTEYLVQAQYPDSDKAIRSILPQAEFVEIPCPARLSRHQDVENVHVTQNEAAVERLFNAVREDPRVDVRVFQKHQGMNWNIHDCTEKFLHPHKLPAKIANQIAAVEAIAGKVHGPVDSTH